MATNLTRIRPCGPYVILEAACMVAVGGGQGHMKRKGGQILGD